MAWLERHRLYVVGALLAIIGVGVVALLLRRQDAGPIEFLPTPEPSPIVALKVYVTGAVVSPGVYSLREGDRVEEALAAAGGPSEKADLERINLAAHVRDEMQVHVPEKGEIGAPEPLGPAQQGAVNLNTASQAELETLPGIGPIYAQRIIEYRQANGAFTKLESLKDVPGIGDATFEKIKSLITI